MIQRLALVALTMLIGVSACNCGHGGRATEAPITAATPTRSSGSVSINIDLGLYVIDESAEGEPLQIADFPTRAPRWTASGNRLYFMGGAGQDPSDVYTSSATGGGLIKLLETGSEPPAFALFHSFSPDLSQVAYQIITSDGEWAIRIADLTDPASDRKLADGMLGAWSPDGAFVGYYSPSCENLSLFVTTPAGRQQMVEPFVEGSLFRWASWLPGKSRLAYQKMMETASSVVPDGTFVFDVDTSGTLESPELSWLEWEPTFSPDGNWIVYTDQKEGEQGVYLGRWGEKTSIRIGGYSLPVWAPQSDKIALVESGMIEIYDVATGTSHLINLHHVKGLPQGMSFWMVDVSWSPDGKRLAVAVRAGFPRGFCD